MSSTTTAARRSSSAADLNASTNQQQNGSEAGSGIQSPQTAGSPLGRPTFIQIVNAHLAFNDDLSNLLKEISDVCSKNPKKLASLKTQPDEWVATLAQESKRLNSEKAKFLNELQQAEGDADNGQQGAPSPPPSTGFRVEDERRIVAMEVSEIALVDIAGYLEKQLFLASSETTKLKKLGREVAQLLVLRSLGLLHREVSGLILHGSSECDEITRTEQEKRGPDTPTAALVASALTAAASAAVAVSNTPTSSQPNSPARSTDRAASQEAALGGAAAASGSPAAKSVAEDQTEKSDDIPSARTQRRAVVSDAIGCIGDCFMSMLQYLPPSTCDDATVRHLVRLCTETIKSVDRTLFILQSALLHVVAEAIRGDWYRRCQEKKEAFDDDDDDFDILEQQQRFLEEELPTEEEVLNIIETHGEALVEHIGIVECLQLRTMHELVNAPMDYLIAVVSVSQAGTNPATVTAKTQANTKSLLFQLVGVLAHQTLPQSAAASPLTIDWFRRAAIVSVYRVCDPILFSGVTSLSRHCGDQNPGELLAVKLLTDSVATLAVDDPLSLRSFVGSSLYSKDILVALLTCCVSVHPSVLGASLRALKHLLLEATAEIAQEAGFIYCNCLMRLLESENTSTDNKVAIVKHINDAVVATHQPRSRSAARSSTADGHENESNNNSSEKNATQFLLFELFWLYDLNVRMHHANMVQHVVASLSRIVRCASSADFCLPQDLAVFEATGTAVTPNPENQELPQTLPVASLNALVSMLETLTASIAATNTVVEDHHEDHHHVKHVKSLREEKIRLQRMVDIINTTPVKGIAKLVGMDHKELLRPPKPLAEESTEDSETEGGSSLASPAVGASAPTPPAPPVDDDPDGKKMLINEYKDVPETYPHNLPMLDGIADFLLHTPSLNPASVGEFLSEPKVLPLQCCKVFMSKLRFHGKSITQALGEVLSVLQLPKEGQRIERILEFFARAYYDSNAGHQGIEGTLLFPFKNVDACFVVIVATVMLNTDLHNPRVSSKMTIQSFAAQLRGCNDNGNFPEGFAEGIFESISRKQLSNVKGLGAAGVDGSGAGHAAAAPESSRMDLLFFSKDERKELMFGIERQRIMTETKESIVRRSKQGTVLNMPPVPQVAREMFTSTWPAVHVVLGVALQHSDYPIAPAVQQKCIKGLQCCLTAAAAFGLGMEGEVTLNALLKIASASANGGSTSASLKSDGALRAVLTVGTSSFGKNLNENAWCSLCNVMATIGRGSNKSGAGGNAAAAPSSSIIVSGAANSSPTTFSLSDGVGMIYNSLNAIRKEAMDNKWAMDAFTKIVGAAFTACFTVPCNDSATLGGHLQVVRNVLLPVSIANTSLTAPKRRSGSSSNLSAPAAAPLNEALAVLQAFSGVCAKAIPKLCGIHQQSSDCVQLILNLYNVISQYLHSFGLYMMAPSGVPPTATGGSPVSTSQPISSVLCAVFDVAPDNSAVQLKVVQAVKSILPSLIPTGNEASPAAQSSSNTMDEPVQSNDSLSSSPLTKVQEAQMAKQDDGLLFAVQELFKIVGMALTAGSESGNKRTEITSAGVLALGEFVDLCVKQRFDKIPKSMRSQIALTLTHLSFVGAACCVVAASGISCVGCLEDIVAVMANELQNVLSGQDVITKLAEEREFRMTMLSGSPTPGTTPPPLGYAANFAMPAGQASPATPSNLDKQLIRRSSTLTAPPPPNEAGERRGSIPLDHSLGADQIADSSFDEQDFNSNSCSAFPPVSLQHVVSSGLERLALLIASDKEHSRSASVHSLSKILPRLTRGHLEQIVIFSSDIILECTLDMSVIPRFTDSASPTHGGGIIDTVVPAYKASFTFLGLAAPGQRAISKAAAAAGGKSPTDSKGPVVAFSKKVSRMNFISTTFPHAVKLLVSDAITKQFNPKQHPSSLPESPFSAGASDVPLVNTVLTRCLVPLAVARSAPGAVRTTAARCIPNLAGSSSTASLPSLRTMNLIIDAISIVAASLLFPAELIAHHQQAGDKSSGKASPSATPFSFPVGSEVQRYMSILEEARPSCVYKQQTAATTAGGLQRAASTVGRRGSNAGEMPPLAPTPSQASTPSTSASAPTDAVCFASEAQLAELTSIMSGALEPLASCLPPLLLQLTASKLSFKNSMSDSFCHPDFMDDPDASIDTDIERDTLSSDPFALPRSSMEIVVGLLLTASNTCLALSHTPKLLSASAFQQLAQRPGHITHKNLFLSCVDSAISALYHMATSTSSAGTPPPEMTSEHSTPPALSSPNAPSSPSKNGLPTAGMSVAQKNLHNYSLSLFSCLRRTANAAPSSGSSSASAASSASLAPQLSLCIANWMKSLKDSIAPLLVQMELEALDDQDSMKKKANKAGGLTDAEHQMLGSIGAKAVWSVCKSPAIFQAIVSTLAPSVDPSVIQAVRQYLELYQRLEMGGCEGMEALSLM